MDPRHSSYLLFAVDRSRSLEILLPELVRSAPRGRAVSYAPWIFVKVFEGKREEKKESLTLEG